MLSNSFLAPKNPLFSTCSSLSSLPTPGNHWAFYDLHTFVLSRMLYSWNHASSLFKLFYFALVICICSPMFCFWFDILFLFSWVIFHCLMYRILFIYSYSFSQFMLLVRESHGLGDLQTAEIYFWRRKSPRPKHRQTLASGEDMFLFCFLF